MERRAFLKGLGALYGSASVAAGISDAAPVSAISPLSRFKLGAISDGFSQDALDKKRIWHIHLKGVTCDAKLKNCSETFAGQGQIDLVGQFRQLVRDSYRETMSLECEFVAPGLTQPETSKISLEGLLRDMAIALNKDGC